jgi:hypothetical protein
VTAIRELIVWMWLGVLTLWVAALAGWVSEVAKFSGP